MAASVTTAPGASTGRAGRVVSGAGLVLLPLALIGLMISVLSSVLAEQQSGQPGGGLGGDPYAVMNFGAMYRDAATVFGVNPYLLMAVHEDESDYGRSTLPGVHDGVNLAGCCAGPEQFSIVGGRGGTWAAYSDSFTKAKIQRPADYPNRHEPHPSVYDSFDAIYAAAAYFKALGAGPALDERTYNALLHWTGSPPSSIPYATKDYLRARVLESTAALVDGMPIGDTQPRTLQRVIAVANWIDQQNQPYCWSGGHGAKPGPSAGDWCIGTHTTSLVGLDCSGAVRWLLVLSGYPDPGGISSENYGRYLQPKDGQHVTFHYGPPGSKIGHIYVTIDGRAWEASPAAPGALAGWSGARKGTGYATGHVEGL
jgi:hypothetical protein